jgi:hypothetical protein
VSIRDLVTPAWLKARYLFGIDLTDDENEPFPDSLFEHAIDAAIDLIAAEFGVEIDGSGSFIERKDVTKHASGEFLLLYLNHRPVRAVTAFAYEPADWGRSPLPLSWVEVQNSRSGQIQVVPGRESSRLPLSIGMPFMGLGGYSDNTPALYTFTYDAGFEWEVGTVSAAEESTRLTGVGTTWKQSGPTGVAVVNERLREGRYIQVGDEIRKIVRVRSNTELDVDVAFSTALVDEPATYLGYPPAFLDLVGLVASALPLDTAGDLIAGAGIASKSTSHDSLSTSVNTTSSATNSGYGARMLSYTKRFKELVSQLRREWRAIEVAVI